jgi:hypothetical protein
VIEIDNPDLFRQVGYPPSSPSYGIYFVQGANENAGIMDE